MKHAILSFVLLLFCTFALAQNSLTPMVENLVEQIAESREEEDFSFLYENLLELAENKLNLNTATREQNKRRHSSRSLHRMEWKRRAEALLEVRGRSSRWLFLQNPSLVGESS